jgi:hypothetical protein
MHERTRHAKTGGAERIVVGDLANIRGDESVAD